MFPSREKPDFSRLEDALRNRERKGRVPFIEIGVDREIIEAIIGRNLPDPGDPDNWDGYHAGLIDFYGGLGYDYVLMGIRCHQEDPHYFSPSAEDTAPLSRGTRHWAPMDGIVKTREAYEEFPWAEPDSPELEELEDLARVLPEGMKILAVTVCVMEPLAERVMGVKALSRALYRDPDLVRDVCARLGEPAVSAAGEAAKMDSVGAVAVCDDFGYQSGTLLSPENLRRYILPWHRRLVHAVHAQDKPAILHSCGNVQAVMDEIIDFCGYDAKHAFKDSHTPITLAKKLWGDRIALLGGIDMDFLARREPGEVRQYVRGVIELCGSRGFALGAGNSVSNYIPVENFLAMLEEGRRAR